MSSLALRNATLYRSGEYRRGSVVIAGDRIEAIVDPSAAIVADRVIDLAGAFLLPGFVDTHFHLTSLAVKRSRCDLATAHSAGEAVEVLGAYAAHAAGPHVMGVDWDDSKWSDGGLPTRVMLDAIDAKRPVFARRICGHVGVVNSVLLDRLTPNEALIDKTSGEVREHAAWQANAICEVDGRVLASHMGDAIAALHRMGVTGIHDIVEPARFEAYLAGVQHAPTALAIDVLLHVHPREFDGFVDIASRCGAPGVRLVGVKCFLDGSLGGRTAALHQPYADHAGNGTLLLEPAELEDIVRGCAARNITCAMHAIGDRAIDTILDVLERVAPATGHYRIEHAEITGPRQVERLAQAPVFLSMQPNFVRNWGQPGGMYEQRLGSERFASMNRFRTLLDAGLQVIFGSDGMPPGPLFGLKGSSEHPIECERLTVEETFAAFTTGADRAGNHGRGAGRIEPAATADLVAWDRDPLADEKARVRLTVCGGRVVWSDYH